MSELDIASLDSMDEATMIVQVSGKPIDWAWKFAGPGHPAGIEQRNRIAREELTKRKLQEQAQVNGRKWKAVDRDPDSLLDENVTFVLERLLGWSPVKMGGQDYPFTRENARALLTDKKKGALLQQAIDFLLDDASFTQPSANS